MYLSQLRQSYWELRGLGVELVAAANDTPETNRELRERLDLPFTLLSDQSNFTLATGLTKLIFGDVFLWGMIMAGGVLMSAPLLVLYFVAQRYIVAGLSAGAIKG